MKIFKTVLLLFILSVSTNTYAVTYHEYSDEGPFIAFYLGKDLTGYAKSKMCESCKLISHKITADAQAFLDGKQVPLKTFVLSGHKPSVLHFSTKDNKLTRIIWYRKNK